MARAARLASLEERRWVAAGLLALVEQAEDRRSGSPFLVVRRRCVMNQREALLALAERLSRPAPVHVAAVAQLSVLVSDSYSPAYAGGADPARLSEVTSRCLAIVAD
jgi:hypothetical protein